jgi:hypothetical protein
MVKKLDVIPWIKDSGFLAPVERIKRTNLNTSESQNLAPRIKDFVEEVEGWGWEKVRLGLRSGRFEFASCVERGAKERIQRTSFSLMLFVI